MNRPGHFEYAIGNRLGIAVFWAVTSASTIACCNSVQATPLLAWLVPVTGLAFANKAVRARRNVLAFRSWKRDWDGLAAGPESLNQQGAPPRPRKRIPWAFGLTAAWVLATGYLIVHAGEDGTPEYGFAAFSFMSLSALGLAAGLFKAGRRVLGRGARATRTGGHIVSVCVRPLSTPSPARITLALPDYCRALLARSQAAPTR